MAVDRKLERFIGKNIHVNAGLGPLPPARPASPASRGRGAAATEPRVRAPPVLMLVVLAATAAAELEHAERVGVGVLDGGEEYDSTL